MFDRPDNWKDLTPNERLLKRLDHMVSARGINFIDEEAESAYKERATLIRDAVELKKIPARIPVFPSHGEYPFRHAGLTPYEMYYDHENETMVNAPLSFDLEFQPDVGSILFPCSGILFEILDCKMLKWPGHGIPKESGHQFVEREYMFAEEYPHFLADPTDFLLRRFFPRVHGTLKPLEKLPSLTEHIFATTVADFIPFAAYDIQEALLKLIEAGKEAMRVIKMLTPAMMASKAAGFPSFMNFGGLAPFDIVGDLLRGSKGIMTDMYRRPEAVIAACEKLLPFIINGTLSIADRFDTPLIGLPLHKGDDYHMSPDQFKKFYWPTLKEMMQRYSEEGLIPICFAEGSYNMRLEIIADFPKGHCVWYFDKTDMKRAKEVLKDVCCIMGNVPASLILTGTPDDIRAYCKNLIDVCGKGGGFIMTTGASIDYAKPENIKAMIDFTKEYGVYR